MTDSTDASGRTGRPPSAQIIPGVNPLNTPAAHRFDPPLEHRPYEEILAEVNAAMAAMEKRRFGRKKVK